MNTTDKQRAGAGCHDEWSQGHMDTETIDALFLELSQFTTATTAKEIALEQRIAELESKLREVACGGVELQDDRMSYVVVQIDADLWRELQASRDSRPGGEEER